MARLIRKPKKRIIKRRDHAHRVAINDPTLELPRPKKCTMADYRNGGNGFGWWVDDFICLPVYPEGSSIPIWTPMNKMSSEIHPETGRSYVDIWENQKIVARDALQMTDGKFKHRLIILIWMRGEGKCQAKGSEVIMFDGSVKKVEDVIVGDLLMGDDNTPRKVLELHNGREEMFDVIPYRGEKMTVTNEHILTLKDREYNKIHDMSLNKFMAQNKSFRKRQHVIRVPLDFSSQQVTIEPYFMGIWLGDGSAGNTTITTIDKEVQEYLKRYSKRLNLNYTERTKKGTEALTCNIIGKQGYCKENPEGNQLLKHLYDYDLIKNKYIPKEYKINSREVRLEVLAGLIDSDGYLNRNSFQITQKSKALSKDILFLARSLGFHAEMKKCTKTIKSIGFSGEYYTIGISGNCSIIPTRLSRKRASKRKQRKPILESGIKEVRSAGVQEYYGFAIDGNHRYVTGDFTVTHNSLFACLLQLWKFFCFPRQQIMLGANSKDQVKFVHYDIMKDIILNSPKMLNIVGRKNVQEKEIRLRDKKGNIGSFFRSISSFSGIVSNVTGYTFSEMFDMKNPKFFVQLDGSIRNMPNAMGVIDSTVSEKSHILYKLYKTFTRDEDPTLFVSYRCSQKGSHKDFWNPQMTQRQLDSYKAKFPAVEFDRYFRNVWEAGSNKLFSPTLVEATHYLGINGTYGMQADVLKCIDKIKARSKNIKEGIEKEAVHDIVKEQIQSDLINIHDVYSLTDGSLHPRMADLDDLMRLTDLYKTNWALCIGVDRADPMKINKMVGAKTIVTITAKGLPNSLNNPDMYLEEGMVKNYIYFMMHLAHIESNELEHIKKTIKKARDEFGSIETLCAERWGMWDIAPWCEKQEIQFEPISPTYERQRAAFTELYTLYKTGMFKTPIIRVPGVQGVDILVEEAEIFDSNPFKKWYGSPQKNEKFGIQDDSMFALGLGIYGGRNLGIEDLVERKNTMIFAEMFTNSGLIGDYS